MKKKRNTLFIIIGILIFVSVAIISALIFYNNRPLKYKNSISIKIGESLPTIESYIDSEELNRLDNKEIKWENINLEDNKIYNSGKYTGYITFKNKKIELTLEVIDDEIPTIEGVEDITIYVNQEAHLLKNIKTNDNSHDEVSVNIKGEYDTFKVGEYVLSYVAKDKSGNEAVKEFKLIVKEKEVIKVPTSIGVKENITIGTTSKGYTIKRVNGIYYVNDILIANKTYALPSSYTPGKLLDTFMNAFNTMQAAALSEGISIKITSGYRSYSTQYSLYNRYVQRDGKELADTYSARAGHSEHQSGIAADIGGNDSSINFDQRFINTPEGQWVNNNCYKYGFIIRYPKGKESITGYMYEPWHIRYVGVDIATSLYNNGNWISLEEYLGITSKYNY